MKNLRDHKRRVSRHDSRRASALIEFAIVLPLLLLVGLGCADFGRFAYEYCAVSNAAEEGATFGALNPIAKYGNSTSAWTAEAQAAAVAEHSNLTNATITTSEVTVTNFTTTAADPPEMVGYVTCTVTHNFNMLLLAPGVISLWGPANPVPMVRTVRVPHTR